MSVTSGGTALKPFSSGGRSSALAGSAGMSITFFTPQFPPSRCHPDRRRQILERHDDADEAVVLPGVVSRRNSSTI
jgi:hypothetical protein